MVASGDRPFCFSIRSYLHFIAKKSEIFLKKQQIFNFDIFISLKKVYYRLIGDFYGEISLMILNSVSSIVRD